jgi:hypothetical protein
MTAMTGDLRRMSVALFEGFELLDVFGPAELFSLVPGQLAIEFTGPRAGPVASSQGVQVTAATGYDAAATPDIMLIPGGQGTRRLVTDEAERRVRCGPAVRPGAAGDLLPASSTCPDQRRSTAVDAGDLPDCVLSRGKPQFCAAFACDPVDHPGPVRDGTRHKVNRAEPCTLSRYAATAASLTALALSTSPSRCPPARTGDCPAV